MFYIYSFPVWFHIITHFRLCWKFRVHTWIRKFHPYLIYEMKRRMKSGKWFPVFWSTCQIRFLLIPFIESSRDNSKFIPIIALRDTNWVEEISKNWELALFPISIPEIAISNMYILPICSLNCLETLNII